MLVSPNLGRTLNDAFNAEFQRQIMGLTDGFAIYLGYAYNVIEYFDTGGSAAAYPTPESRLIEANRVIRKLAQDSSRRLDDAINEWRKKYGQR
jgi:hypothetical protein